MTCPACLAHDAPHSGMFTVGCLSCCARALAGTGGHLASKTAGRVLPEYREALEALFGADWQEGAQLVKGWAARQRQEQKV